MPLKRPIEQESQELCFAAAAKKPLWQDAQESDPRSLLALPMGQSTQVLMLALFEVSAYRPLSQGMHAVKFVPVV